MLTSFNCSDMTLLVDNGNVYIATSIGLLGYKLEICVIRAMLMVYWVLWFNI